MKPEREYHSNGKIWIEEWRNEARELHRLDGPAYRQWFEDGRVNSEEWWVNGKTHRLDEPAFRMWYKNGRLECEGWFINSNHHRLDGPAKRVWLEDGRLEEEAWFINGVHYGTEAEFQVAVDLYKANEIAELF